MAGLTALLLGLGLATGPAASARSYVATVPTATVVTAAVPAAAVPMAKKISDRAARQARAAANVARATVDAQLQKYQDAEVQVDAGVRALSAAFGAGADADVNDDQAAAQARRARVLQAEQVRAVYADGGPAGLTASILGATSPADALWRASTADRVLNVLFNDAQQQVTTQAGLARLAHRRADQADAAASAQASALIGLQKNAAVAEQALTQAQQTLANLDSRAQQAEAALASARQIAAAQAAAERARRAAMGPVSALDIPAEYLKAYQGAARTCPGMDWTLLAGVGQVESGHGRNEGPSSAGAIGPMQFLPSTFVIYAVDGDHNGVLDPLDPEDAIFTAAHYLCVSGAKGGSAAGIHAALLTYNHAEWYVDLVLAAQQAIIAQQAALKAP